MESAPGRLSPAILDVACDPMRTLAEPHLEVFAPGYYFRAVVHAAYIQRTNRLLRNPTEALANSPMCARVQESTLQTTLRSIVNQTIAAMPDPTAPVFASRGCAAYEGICHKADFHFATLIADIENDTMHDNFGARVIRDANGKPILVQKAQGNMTALSLSPITIEQTTYPSGSIMGIHLEQDYGGLTGKYSPSMDPGTLTDVSFDEIDGIDYLRPSLLGLHPRERPAYLRHCTVSRTLYQDAYGVLSEYTLGEIIDTFSETR